MNLDDATWIRARAWAIAVAASGISYYWHTYPTFVAECRARLREILTDAVVRLRQHRDVAMAPCHQALS
jgi:hypothetical protein